MARRSPQSFVEGTDSDSLNNPESENTDMTSSTDVMTESDPTDLSQLEPDSSSHTAAAAAVGNPDLSSDSDDSDSDTITDSDEDDSDSDEDDSDSDGAGVTDSTQSAAAAPVEINIDAFMSAVDLVIPNADTSTGELSVADIQTVKTAYVSLDGLKNKGHARTYIQEKLKTAMLAGDIVLARSYWQLGDQATVTPAAQAAKSGVPVDPTLAAVQRWGQLRLALELCVPMPNAPADFDAKVTAFMDQNRAEAQALLSWLQNTSLDKGDSPVAANMIAKRVVSLALGKTGSSGRPTGSVNTKTSTPHDGAQRSIYKHLQSAFDGMPVGSFLSISDIVKHKSAEYGEDSPSSGAVSARFFPTVIGKVFNPIKNVGFEPFLGGDDSKIRGVKKTAETTVTETTVAATTETAPVTAQVSTETSPAPAA